MSTMPQGADIEIRPQSLALQRALLDPDKRIQALLDADKRIQALLDAPKEGIQACQRSFPDTPKEIQAYQRLFLDADKRIQAYRQARFDASEMVEAFAKAFWRADDKENPPVGLRGFRLVQGADDKQIPLGLPGFRLVRPADHSLPESFKRDDDNIQELRQDTQPEQAVVSVEALKRAELPPPLLNHLRHLLQTRFPVLYAQVLEPTLADLREEHSAALAEGRPFKARCVLLRGCGALAAAAVCQLGYSLLGRIAALWQARSPK